MDNRRIGAILEAACERLEGDWLLVGGALVAAWYEPRRVTEDIDLVGMRGSADERRRLMAFADSVGLPVEAVNSASDFFVRRIEGWEREVELFRAGAQGRIFRPTPTLFLLLKCRRLSAQDLADCLELVAMCRRRGLAIDAERVELGLGELPVPADPALGKRRSRLAAALRARPGGRRRSPRRTRR